jgi:hypothetical protein
MLLARVQACVNCFLLTHSTDEVNSIFKCHKTLPAGKLPGRTNEVYENDSSFRTILVHEFDDNYTNSLIYKLAKDDLVRVVNGLVATSADLFVADYSDDWARVCVTLENLAYAPTLSDRAVAQAVFENGGTGCIQIIDGIPYFVYKDNKGESRYAKIYNTDEFGIEELLFYAGLYYPLECFNQCDPEGSCILSNQAASAAQQYDSWGCGEACTIAGELGL